LVYFLATIKYPTKVAKEFGKKFLELTKMKTPEWLKVVHAFSVPDGLLKGYALYEVEDAKILKAQQAINKRLAIYFDLEGFEYKIERLMEAKEALPIIGLA
jgi:hypothetical protein